MDLVDDIHLLSVSYRFENVIEESLKQIHQNTYGGDNMENDDNLYTTTLRFQLLRQQACNL